jgi:hypothetical protein
MAKVRFGEGMDVLPHIAPVAITESAVNGCDLALKYANWVSFLVQWGVFTSDATDTITITVETSTGTSTAATDVAIPFTYRLSAAVGTDTWGAATTCSTAGLAITATQDSMMLLIDVNPDSIPGEDSDADYIRVVVTPTTGVSTVISAIAAFEPKYQKVDIPDIT